ncbi:MAG: DUF5678 domain-containing protein [Nanoarchaeota archaeon]
MEGIEVLQEFKILENGSSFITKNFAKLQIQYPNKFIAVENNSIIASNQKVEDLISSLNSMGKELGKILIEYIPEKGIIILY